MNNTASANVVMASPVSWTQSSSVTLPGGNGYTATMGTPSGGSCTQSGAVVACAQTGQITSANVTTTIGDTATQTF
jgi:hypothetical protein